MPDALKVLVDNLLAQHLLTQDEAGVFFQVSAHETNTNTDAAQPISYTPKNVLVTGGAGFIGSHFIRFMLATHPKVMIINFDKLTYAGNLDNIRDVAAQYPDRYTFIQGDIADAPTVGKLLATYPVDTIVNFAAETHVDRSILDAGDFMRTDVLGTRVLLEAVRTHKVARMVQVSTDEVYGSIPEDAFTESSPLAPNSPYAASKAGGDLLARAYHMTYKVPVVITRCSKNYGPFQHPEKLIPLFTTNLLEGKKAPLYGDGLHVRDWLFVGDHCRALNVILTRGVTGEVYNIGGGEQKTNLEITEHILTTLHLDVSRIMQVQDREGHDRRYAIDCTKLRGLGWMPLYRFADALTKTIHWYADNMWWWKKIKNPAFQAYYAQQYDKRSPI